MCPAAAGNTDLDHWVGVSFLMRAAGRRRKQPVLKRLSLVICVCTCTALFSDTARMVAADDPGDRPSQPFSARPVGESATTAAPSETLGSGLTAGGEF